MLPTNACPSLASQIPPDARRTRTEGLMSESLFQFEWVNIDSIMTGPFAHKNTNKISYIEFNSKSDRDAALKFIGDNDIKFYDLTMKQMRFDRMNTERQMTRNFALKKAEEFIKAHPRYNGKSIQDE